MDAHFLEYHAKHRHIDLQNEMRAIRLGELARGQRSGRLMRVLRVLFRRASPVVIPAQPPSVSAQHAAAKMAR